MNNKSIFTGFVLCLFLILFSCSDEEGSLGTNKVKVLFSVDEFETIGDSRTTINPDAGYSITWASGDVIGIFPREGYQEPFSIPADQVGNTNATFDGGYWALKDGLTYNAYYPFDKANFDSADMKTMIPVSYVGQEQTGTVCNAGAFDYTYSDWNKAVNGAVSFRFHHIGAIVVFHLEYPATATYTQMTLSADEAVIPTTGTYDLTADNVAFVADNNNKVQSISLSLKNHTGTAGETGTFYMMLPPMDLSQNDLTVSLTASDNSICTYSLESKNFSKGKKYELTGKPIESDIEGSVDGWGEEEKDDTPYLTFKADAVQTLTMSKAVETLEYSVNDGAWAELGTNTVTFGGNYGELRLRGKSETGTATDAGIKNSSIIFQNSTLVDCSGDIRTLIDFDNYTTVDASLAKFCYLFKNNKWLRTAPELPATSLAESCYAYMFYNCTNLATAPTLPATILTDECYRGMFWGCTSLTVAPELSAMTLADGCYSSMFRGCTSLTKAPQLPAQTLVDKCYLGMFGDCTKLASAPKLPVMSLAEYCYNGMFAGCTSLTVAPELPATSLASYCYAFMFEGCTNLSEAPKLPATTLAEGCYTRMFRECTSLKMAPELQASTLITNCYAGMFYGCSNLGNIIMLAENMEDPDYLYEENLFNCLIDWVTGVASSGNFTKVKSTTLPTGNHGIPSGWTIVNYDDTPDDTDTTPYLTFKADAEQTLTMSKAVETIEYSVDDGEWTELGTNTITFGGSNGNLRLRGKSSYGTYNNSYGGQSLITFGNSTKVACSGDIRTLVDYENYDSADTSSARFFELFKNCSVLTSAPELPATTLASKCYSSMFYGCTSLIVAPTLPATKLASQSYRAMFMGCTGLTSAPELPATDLADGCYWSMFSGCKNLNEAPTLPALTLKTDCYVYMFYGCTALTSAPELPATTVTKYCYSQMFEGCTELVSAPVLPAVTLVDFCYSRMFYGCSKLNKITMWATSITKNSLQNWVTGVASSGTFTKADDASLPTGDSGIPSGWSVMNYSETLVDDGPPVLEEGFEF